MTDKKRLDYLDSLRGVAMLCVIYFHICVYLLGGTTPINDSLDRWQMPLFFFISGFFAFSPVYDAALFRKRVRNRIYQQLYPTVAVWLLFIVCSWLLSVDPLTEHFKHGLYDPAKVGYWFTFSLVQVFVIYALMAFMLSYFKVSVRRQTAIYAILIVIFAALSLLAVDDAAMHGAARRIWNVLSLGKTVKLVAFFFAGALVRMHWQSVSRLMKHYWFAALCLAAFALTSFFTPDGDASGAAIYLASRISGLLFMVSLFVCLQRFVSAETRLGRYLQRIGRNTLPIYLFHFFILLLVPQFIDDAAGILRRLSSNPFIELISFTTISVIFAEITLAVDSLLKMVPCAHKAIFAK